MSHQPNLTAFKFALRGMLGGIIIPGVLGTILIMRTLDERHFVSVPWLVLAAVFYSGAIGVVIGFIVGLLYAAGLSLGFLKRLLISIGLTALVSLLLTVALGVDDWLRQAQVVGFLVLISGILPAITTGRLYPVSQPSEVL